MISMIIADDELVIRQGLLTIPWNEYGIEVIGAASNGEEALKLSKTAKPQILLTDIRMPGMDGLKLIENIKTDVPEVKAILLTGYQDFEYARSAIQLGATGYVLKPSDPDEIITIVLKAKKQIEEEIKEKLEKSYMLQKMDNAKAAVLKAFLQDLIFGRIQDPQTIMEKCRELNYTFDHCVVLFIELKSETGEISSESLGRIREEIYTITFSNCKCTILDIHPSSFCVILEMSACEEAVKDKMLALAMDIENRIKNKFDLCVSIGISRCCNNAADLHIAFNQAVNCLKMEYSHGKANITHIDNLKDELQSNKVISDIIDYIEKFYMDEISLLTVSEHVHMNHIYISRLIRKETGETFLDILTKTRMKKACELLVKNEYKSYEISYRVGIKDAGYFSQVFKKYYGATPSEYREKMLSKYMNAKEYKL